MGNATKVNGGHYVCVYIYIYSVSSSRTVNAETLSCIFLFERHIFNAPLSMEDANMTAFFPSSVVTWSSALLDGKILDLVCSGDSTQPSKVILRGYFEGRFECLPSNTIYRSFFMFLRNL